VKVLTTTPHYNVTPSALRDQPLKRRWAGLFHQSDFDGTTVWHVSIGKKGQKVAARIFDYIRFHFLSLVVGALFVGRYEIVLSPSPPLSIGVSAWLLGLMRRAPSVYNVQEIFPDFLIRQGLIRNAWLISAVKRLEKFVYRASRKVVVISPWFAKIIATRGVGPGKLLVIPNFVNTDLYRPLPRDNEFARRHHLNHEFTILYAGNIGLSLDLELVLDAAAKLDDLAVRFVFVGDGVRANWLADEISSRQLRNVVYLGYQPQEVAHLIYPSCDLAMIPMKAGTTTDTFPSKVYTILASGKPVLVSADSASELHWMVREWRCGRVVKPEDRTEFVEAVRHAYLEHSVLAQEGEAGRIQVVAKYSKEAVGAQYDRLIAEVLAR
jgi:colanic acid biosynthesis glycosyl transferase WcaI